MTMLHTRIAYPKHETKTATIRDEGFRPDVMAATKKPDTAPPGLGCVARGRFSA
jgi:hypothetical protein